MTREQARQEINRRISELPKAKRSANGYDTYICPLCGNGSGKDGDGIATKDGTHYKCFKCGESGDYLHYIRKKHDCPEDKVFADYNISIDDESARTARPKNEQNTNGDHQQDTQEPPKKILPQPKSEKSPQTFTLYYNKVRGQVGNNTYPYQVEVKDEESFAAAVMYDHVGATYKEKTRGKENFILADGVMMDWDNDGTDDPAEWVDESHIEEHFKGVPHYICHSRNHMKPKDGKSPRPKGHVYFPIEPVTDAEDFVAIKQALIQIYPAFCDGALDAGRFFAGVENPEVAYYPGDKNLLTWLHENPPEKFKYMETSAAHHIAKFNEEIAAQISAIHTGFDKLDNALDGGLYPGLYIVGAITSLGKTTFTLQIADQIAQRGQDVLIFSLEMSRYELMAKSISRLTVENSEGKTANAKTTRGILSGDKYSNYSKEETDLIKNSIIAYSKYAKNIYIHEGVGNIGVEEIREEIEKHFTFIGKPPVVIIDYLQIIAPYEPKANDKQNTDKAVLELKRISRDKKIPVIAVSSFNRDNYTAPVNLASFKESGAIEYSSDILLGLQLAGMDTLSQSDSKRPETMQKIEDMKVAEPRKAQLKILKNRNGRIGISLYYEYYPMFNLFKEGKEGDCL